MLCYAMLAGCEISFLLEMNSAGEKVVALAEKWDWGKEPYLTCTLYSSPDCTFEILIVKRTEVIADFSMGIIHHGPNVDSAKATN